MVKKIIIFSACLFLSSLFECFADTVYLKNGSRVSGIITKEDEKAVEIKINIGAKVTFSREDIQVIEKESDEKNSRMEEAWEAGRNKSEVQEITNDVFEEEQIKKGLVKY